MKKFVSLSLLFLFSSGCISLFSEIEINESGNQHHVNSVHNEELEHRISELEERVQHLMEILEERERDFEHEEEREEKSRSRDREYKERHRDGEED